jgi:hypothetical protein
MTKLKTVHQSDDITKPNYIAPEKYSDPAYVSLEEKKAKSIEQLIKELSAIGNVIVIKNDYVFTLYMTKNKLDLANFNTQTKVINLVAIYCGEEKPMVEILKTDNDFILLVFKPKQSPNK